MIGDGAVVRKAAIYYADDKVDMPLNVRLVARAYLERAAEIERLTQMVEEKVALVIEACRLASQLRHRAEASEARTADLLKALERVVANVLDYEHVNNLAPNPGRKYCWDSVEHAVAVIAAAKGETV